MTKKEQAQFDAAILRAETLAALRWTDIVERDLPAPGHNDSATSGWDFNSHSCTVREGWSESVVHGYGPKRSNKYSSASQGCRSLFSTKALALMALRNEVEKEAAEKLRKIDMEIRAAKSGLQPPTET